MFQNFRKFILRGNVVDLAVGLVVGSAFSSIVNALVKDLITPFLAAIGHQPDFSKLTFTINDSQFMYGDFLNSVISFFIIASAIYFLVVLPINKFKDFSNRGKTIDPTIKKCPECLSDIPIGAKRCAYCTTILIKKNI